MTTAVEQSEYTKRYEYVAAQKNSGCVECQDQRPPSTMRFVHTRGERRGAISELMKDYELSLDQLQVEIDKCDLLCSTCAWKRGAEAKRKREAAMDPQLLKFVKSAARSVSRRNKHYVLLFKQGNACVGCGCSGDTEGTRFVHTRGVKVADVSKLTKTASLDELRAEIDKCDLLCKPCATKRWIQNKPTPLDN